MQCHSVSIVGTSNLLFTWKVFFDNWIYLYAYIFIITMDHRLYSAPCHHQINMLLAHGIRQIWSLFFYVRRCLALLCSALFYCLSIISNWWCKSKFFYQSFAAAFSPNLFTAQVFYCTVYGSCLVIIIVITIVIVSTLQ